MSQVSIGNSAVKIKFSAKKPKKKGKLQNRIPIHHDLGEINRHEEHRINVAISRINQIIKLIFKNSKDSVAITAGSGGSIIVPNRAPGEDQRFMELSKIIKLMQM